MMAKPDKDVVKKNTRDQIKKNLPQNFSKTNLLVYRKAYTSQPRVILHNHSHPGNERLVSQFENLLYQQTKVLPYDHLNRWQKKHSTNSTSATIERVSTSPCWSSLSFNSELLGHPVTSALRQLKKSPKLAVCSGLCWRCCDCNIQG